MLRVDVLARARVMFLILLVQPWRKLKSDSGTAHRPPMHNQYLQCNSSL